MRFWRKLYFRIFTRYRRLETRFVRYSVADELIKDGAGKGEIHEWHISPEEDRNGVYGYVHIERRERITE